MTDAMRKMASALACLLCCLCLRAQDSLSIDKDLLEEYCKAF